MRAFLLAPSSRPGAGLKPGPDLVNLRAWAAGVLFQELRRLGEYRCQPLVDFERPARTKGLWRPLSDAEAQRGRLHCRRHSFDTRRPAAWALGEATAGTAEIALVVVADLDLAAGTVWLSGTSRSLPRYGQLTDWGLEVLALRQEALGNEPTAPLVYLGRGTPQSQQAASCHVLFDILRRAGLGRDTLVKPASLRAWRGVKIFQRAGDITAVAAALGYRSLDNAANAIGWTGPGPAEPPPSTAGATGERTPPSQRGKRGGHPAAAAGGARQPLHLPVRRVPPRPRRRRAGGRPRRYATWLWFAFSALADITTSMRSAAAHLADSDVSELVRREAAKHLDVPGGGLPEQPPSRSWYLAERRRHIQPNTEAVARVTMHLGVNDTLDQGLLDPDKPWRLEDRTRRPMADGKVLSPISRARSTDTSAVYERDPSSGLRRPKMVVDDRTGEIVVLRRPVRHDPEVKSYHTGDGRQVVGHKFAQVTVAGDQTHHRAVIGLGSVLGDKGEASSEADVVMGLFDDLAGLAPGIIGPVTDTVLRGAHLDHMQRDHGWVPVAPVAARKLDHKTSRRLEEKEGPLEAWYRRGRLRKLVWRDGSSAELVDMAWRKVRRNRNVEGTWNIYVEYDFECNCGAHHMVVRQSTHRRVSDPVGFNRAENVRAVPPCTGAYDAIYPFRSASEGDNRAIDDHLWLRRARSYGGQRQLLDLVGHALHLNSLDRQLWAPGAPGATSSTRRPGRPRPLRRPALGSRQSPPRPRCARSRPGRARDCQQAPTAAPAASPEAPVGASAPPSPPSR